MPCAVLSLGSNLQDRLALLRRARAKIAELGSICGESKIYETSPVGYVNQGDFLNCVLALSTELAPEELLKKCAKIELELGRVRSFKDAPRTIDIDIIFYDNLNLKSEFLEIPHPRWSERDFVVTPLLDLLDCGIFKGQMYENLRLFLSAKTRKFKPFGDL